MVQEVRSILFTADECHEAVTTLLVMRNRGLRRDQVKGLNLGTIAASACVTLETGQGAETIHALSENDLMSAILLFCTRAHIPLSTRSQKRLKLVAGCLALTTSINLRAAAPVVVGDKIDHTLGGPDLAVLHTV